MLRTAAVILFVMFTACMPVSAAKDDESTFQFLYHECLEKTEFCIGYVTGAGQVMAMVGHESLTNRVYSIFSLCSGQVTPTSEAMIQSVVNFGREHPDMWSEYILIGATAALRQTWPCR
jgi:hypothetical protein